MLGGHPSLHKYKYMTASKHVLFPKLTTVALFVALVLCPLYLGCDAKVLPGGVVGVWQVDLPAPQKLIYAFRSDGTYKMTITGIPGALAGSWRIDGRQLVMTVSNFTAVGTAIGFSTVPSQAVDRHTVARLTRSTMVWSKSPLQRGVHLKRLAQSEAE
jgi:hypothetical protein